MKNTVENNKTVVDNMSHPEMTADNGYNNLADPETPKFDHEDQIVELEDPDLAYKN